MAGLFDFQGEARHRPDASEPHGGWGYTSCCKAPAHFDCLGQWLNPHDGRLADSTRGPVALVLKCPFCKSTLSRSSTRMLVAGAGSP